MEFRQLKHAIALAETKNFGRAADNLFISQPALTRSIQALEESLGVQLFDRSKREVLLTAYGTTFIEHANGLIQQKHRLKRELILMQGMEVGELVVGTGPYVTATFMAKLIGKLSDLKPGIHVRIVMDNWENLATLLRNEKIDLFIADIRDLEIKEDIRVEMTEEHHGFAICRKGHPILLKHEIHFRDLKHYPLATTKMPESVMTYFSDISISVETDNIYLIKDMVSRSNIICMASLPLVHTELKNGTLEVIPVMDLPPLFTKCGIVTLKNRTLSPASILFTELFRDLDKEFLTLTG